MKDNQNEEINKKRVNEVLSLTKKILKILYIVFIASLILVVIVAVQKLKILHVILEIVKVIIPFFIGFILAWLLRPIVKKLNKKINNNTISSIIVFLLFLLIIGGILYLFIPVVYKEVNELVGLIPSLVEKITRGINDFFTKLGTSGVNLDQFKNRLLTNITNYSTEIAKDAPSTIINFIGSLFSGVGVVAMGLLIGIYMLIDYESIGSYIKKLFPVQWRDDIHALSSKMSTEVRKVVNGTFLVALMVLICDSLGFAIIGLNAPLLFGIFCGVTDLIPYIGPYIGGGVAVMVGFSQDPLVGIGVLIICIVVQILEGYVLQPIVMSKASNLHPVLIIIGLLIFGHFFGIIGMILGTPTLTICKVLLEWTKEKYFV